MNVDDIIRFMEAHGFTFEARGEDGPNVVLHFSAPQIPAIIEIAAPHYAEFPLDDSFESRLTQIH